MNVDGLGSTWTNSSELDVGFYGTGTLKITNGGTVGASGVSINNLSLVVLNVGDKSALSAGTGSLANSGLIRLKGRADCGPWIVHAHHRGKLVGGGQP